MLFRRSKMLAERDLFKYYLLRSDLYIFDPILTAIATIQQKAASLKPVSYTHLDSQCFQMQNCLWYFMLIKDEDFTDALIDRYRELRKTYFSEQYLNQYIDDTIDYLGDAVKRNYEVWGYTFEPEHDFLIPAERNPRSYEQAVAQLKEFLNKRILWMDENIDTLRQYSAESKVKKFNENSN